MSLETLLQAAKYVEYRSEAKARGEEPHDYHTYFKLGSASKDGLYSHVEPLPSKRQQSFSNSSHSAEEIREKRRSLTPVTRDSSLTHEHSGTATREVHNKLEKNRRAHLKECFEALKKQLPNMDDRKTSNLSILRGAIRFIQVLKRKEREYEHDMERLAREKIAFQQRLSILKKDLSTQMDHIDINNFIIPEEDNETTTTASECGALSDFDDSLPQESSNANCAVTPDFTSSSSSSTASSVLVGPVPTTASSASSMTHSKQITSGQLLPVCSKEPATSPPNSFIHESAISVSNRTPLVSSMSSGPTAHSISNTEGCTAQPARVFSTGNLHAMAGIFAAPHTMQVITQPSGIKVITAPNSIMTPNSSVQHISVNHHQTHGQIHVLAPTSNAPYATSTATSKPFSADSLVQVTSKNVPKPHLMSPLALVSPQAMVGIPQGKSIEAASGPSAGSLNLSQKGGSVLSGNVAIAVKSNSSVVASCTSHSNMIATLHVSKPHSQVIQPNLASSIITQGGSQVNNGTHHNITSSLKSTSVNAVRSMPQLSGVAHVAHVVSQSPMSTPVGQLVAPGNHVTPLVGSVSVVSHTGAVHQPSIGKVLASPVLKSVNQINPIPILQQQFLQQVSVGSSNQSIVKPVVVVSMANMVPTATMISAGVECTYITC
ncbi:max-binding protein MNT-like [Uloborus diversus]|uniref:max-binding protein MNT-like n=1 Tax=Uloborus diversus TaxID=327109 RepID=UPI002409E0E1|nr:max-binding protein MNT-like [Uloborus diversus]